MPSFFIDTNILWWYLVESSKHHQEVKVFLDPIIENEDNSLIVNEFVMIELFHLLVKRAGKKGYQIARNLLDEVYPFFEVNFDAMQKSDLSDILEILSKHGMTTPIGGRDASIIHSMRRHKIEKIITHDEDFDNLPGITVLNPISPGT